MADWMVGIDIGGTFTDVAALDIESGTLYVTKVPSVPADPSLAVIAGLESLAETNPAFRTTDIVFFAHGTTVATNALLELKGAKVGLLINRGFRAIYELRGGTRPSGSDLIDTFYMKPVTLVPQRRTFEIGGRILYDGSEREPLDEAAVREAVRRLRADGVNSIAVCYLFSFMNPSHERRTAEIIHEEHPTCRVSLSSVVLPVIREYQRISTTVLDAYVGPVIETYLRQLARRLREAGLTTEQLFIMQSNGGLMRIDRAANYPNQTLLSGPAAGVVFGASMGELTGERNIVTFDMGGTSTDISVLPEGSYQETRQGKISGQDIGTPMIQIRTLGAGGGTIAWIGPDGLLKAGPHSAGADPGPACYARGGEEPTVTDANVVLGYLDPESLVGGRVRLDPRRSEEAIRRRIAEPLGLTLQEAALGIIRVVNVNMEVGLRLSLIERGLDHRKFALVAFGGAGPVHATRVARNVGIPRVVVPPYPGISCAMGLLQTDVKHYYLRTRMLSLKDFPVEDLNTLFHDLETQALNEAREEGFDIRVVELRRQLDLRYPYQGYELTVPCQSTPLTEADKELIRQDFDRLHQEVYGTCATDEIPQVVNVRVMSISRVPKLRLRELPVGGARPPAAARRCSRRVLFEEHNTYFDTPIYRREALLAGNVIEGPAIIEQLDATTVILPGQRAEVDRYGILTIETMS
ncbi:MAG TPA: hydantoinase/oxoprolinase family protein [Chloroflexota bacterium]|nr:hydantoinase/oxoprolinase family protein [Chloroflexota bacterium]